MPIDLQMFDDDLAMAEADIAQTVTLSDGEFPASVSEPRRGEQLEVEGIYPQSDLEVTLRTAIHAAPEIGSALTFAGVGYRVMRVTDCPTGKASILSCEAAHR